MTSFIPSSGLNKKDRRIFAAYLVWEMINLAAIKVSQAFLPYPVQFRIMYLAICVNTAMTLYIFRRSGGGTGDWNHLLALALVVTWMGDFFLTLLNVTLPGYILFCLVEMIYAAYFKPSAGNLMVRLALYGLSLALVWRAGLFSIPNAMAALSLTLLPVNVFCGWGLCLRKKTGWTLCLALGLTLFCGCDYSLLVRALTTGPICRLADSLVWIFYAPAQVLLVMAYAGSQFGSRTLDPSAIKRYT